LHRRGALPQHSQAVVSRRVGPAPVALLGAGAARKKGAALLAATSSAPSTAPAVRSASLALKLVASSLCSVLGVTARAFAAERLKTVPTSTVAAAPFVLTGDMIKWGGLAAVCGAVSYFSKEETPILTETVVEEPASLVDAAPPVEEGEAAAAPEMDMMADLKKRMQTLAEERAAAEAAAQEDAPTDDSTDEWSTGNTAVLEPPKPDEPPQPSGLLEDGPAVDFPVGFPLRDMEAPALEPEPEPEPTASKEEIEMLERMFGVRGED